MRKRSGNLPLQAGPNAGVLALRPGELLGLVKLHLSLYIALSAMAGHVLAAGVVSIESVKLGCWVLLLSCGAGLLNNIQDRSWDRLFSRTATRVMAQKSLPLSRAIVMAIVLVTSGLGGLWIFYQGSWPVLLGLGAIILYNGVYTPMKKTAVSAWAMVPGTLSGMVAPAIGWAAVPNGFSSGDPSGLYIFMAALGLWQLPHFLLLEFKQYSEKHHSSFPGFSGLWTPKEARVQILIWISLFSMAMGLFFFMGWVGSPFLGWFLMILALTLPVFLAGVFGCIESPIGLEIGFWAVNLSMLGFMAVIVLDRI